MPRSNLPKMTKNKLTKKSLIAKMDKSVKRMLKLIEEDGDSFAKKAEMYYQKRPELISHVEEFYRMYRSLAERCYSVSGESKKNIPSDLQSQSSGVSDVVSELNSTCISPDHRSRNQRSITRAAGFDFFLGGNGNSPKNLQRDGYETSSNTDSEQESDCSSINNYNFGNGSGDQGFQRRILELEIELRDVKQRLRLQEGENNVEGDSSPFPMSTRVENNGESFSRIAEHEHESRIANEKIQSSEEEIRRLKCEMSKLKNADIKNVSQAELDSPTETDFQTPHSDIYLEVNQGTDFQYQQGDIESLIEELKMTKDRVNDSGIEISRLKDEIERNRSTKMINQLHDQLKLCQKEVDTWKLKLNSKEIEVSKLQERIKMLKSSLSDRDSEVRKLKLAVSNAEQKISKLQEEGVHFETLNKSVNALRNENDDLNVEVHNLKTEVKKRDAQIDQMQKQLLHLGTEHVEMIAETERILELVEELKSRSIKMEDEIERQKVVILEGEEEKREAIRQLCFSLEHYRDEYLMLRKACMGNKGHHVCCKWLLD